MPRNTFHDPGSVLADYTWDIGHHEEQDAGRDLPVSEVANIANTQVILTQGDLSPVKFSYSGSILKREQLVEMWRWLALCQHQTIHFTDFAGDRYEVTITAFKPVRHPGRNLRGGAGAPLWYWTYTIEMAVITAIAGPMVDAGLTS